MGVIQMAERFVIAAVAVLASLNPVHADTVSAKDTGQAVQSLVALIGAQGGRVDPAEAGAEIGTLFANAEAAGGAAARLPEALSQATRLAVSARNPATREVAGDLSRDILVTLAKQAQTVDSSPLVAAWDKADPMLRERVRGVGMAESDVAAFQRLKARRPAVAKADPVAFWDRQDSEVNRILPTRLSAWEAGAAAAWDGLSEAERDVVAGVLDSPDVPSDAILKKVIGTKDIMGWLAVVNLPMTDAEKKASPDLVAFMESTAFAGPLQKLVKDMLAAVAMANAGPAMGGGMDAVTLQYFRLNNWSAQTNEMSSWESYRYMTQGY